MLVDTKLANNGQAILDEVKKVTDKPITHIVNTHTHGDHNGSNHSSRRRWRSWSQENTAANMAKMPVFQEAANKHGPARPDVQGQDDALRAARSRSTCTTSAPRTPTAMPLSCSETRA